MTDQPQSRISSDLVAKIDHGKAYLMAQMILEGAKDLPWNQVPPEVGWMAIEEACNQTLRPLVTPRHYVDWYGERKEKVPHLVDRAERVLVEAWKVTQENEEITANIYRVVGQKIVDALVEEDRLSILKWIDEACAEEDEPEWREKLKTMHPTDLADELNRQEKFSRPHGRLRELLQDLAQAAIAGVPVPRLIAEGTVELDKAHLKGSLTPGQVQKAIELAIEHSPSAMKKSLLASLIKSTPLEGREL